MGRTACLAAPDFRAAWPTAVGAQRSRPSASTADVTASPILSPDGSTMLTVSGGVARLWRTYSWDHIARFRHTAPWAPIYRGDGARVVLCPSGPDRHVVVDARTGAEIGTAWVTAVPLGFTAEHGDLLLALPDRTIVRWLPAANEIHAERRTHDGRGTRTVALLAEWADGRFSAPCDAPRPRDRRVVTVSHGGAVRLWGLEEPPSTERSDRDSHTSA